MKLIHSVNKYTLSPYAMPTTITRFENQMTKKDKPSPYPYIA